jgi:acyl dehydratase
MKKGDYAEITRRFSAKDVAAYVALGGAPLAPGELPEPLIGALFSYLLGIRLPGMGTNYLKQESCYRQLARIGEPLTARVEITRLRPEKHLVDLATTCRNAAGDIICDGRALVYVGDVGR